MKDDLQEIQDKLRSIQEPAEVLELMKKFFKYLCSEQGFWMLFEIAEQILERENVQDSDAQKMLSAKFLECCRLMQSDFDSITNREKIFRKNLFAWDWIFLKRLVNFGAHGKKVTKQIINRLEGNFSAYRQGRSPEKLFRSWFILENENRFFYSPVFLVLVETLWLDLVKNLWMRKKKIPPQSPKESGSPPSSLFWRKKRM